MVVPCDAVCCVRCGMVCAAGFFETFDGAVGKATKPEEATGRFKTKLSACGLVFKHFGSDIIANLAGKRRRFGIGHR